MFIDYLERTQISVSALRSQLALNDHLRAIAQGREVLCSASARCEAARRLESDFPDIMQWRILDHCTTFTRLYAIYEQFVYALIESMLAFYETNISFQELPRSLTSAYKTGVAKIIEKIGGPRYSDISLINLLENYRSALAGMRYKIEPKAILMHDQNLRLDELCTLFAKCDIYGVKDWLSSSPSIIRFFTDEKSSSTVDAQLRLLIQFRNDAAHGGIEVDDILNSALLLEYVDFIQALCISLAEMVRKEILMRRVQLGTTKILGTVSETFRQGRVAIIRFEGLLDKNQKIYIVERHSCRQSSVLNLQV